MNWRHDSARASREAVNLGTEDLSLTHALLEPSEDDRTPQTFTDSDA